MKQIPIRYAFISLILFCIFSVPFNWLLSGSSTNQVSLIEKRVLSPFPLLDYSSFRKSIKWIFRGKTKEANKIFFDQFLNRSFQNKVEKAAADQFPLRLAFIKVSKAIDRDFIDLAYSPLKDPAIPADMRSGIYVMADESRLIPGIATFNEKNRNRIDNQIKNLKLLINEYPH